jgi:hypothetical protein
MVAMAAWSMMVDVEIDEERAKSYIAETEAELERQRSKGSENVDAQRSRISPGRPGRQPWDKWTAAKFV